MSRVAVRVVDVGVPRDQVPEGLAKPGCRRCFGRGFTGAYSNGNVVPCRCAVEEARRRVAARKEAPGAPPA